MALVAITGGCGYVGNVAKAFKEKGFETSS